ncbi:MAG TPA: PepSY-associated TM helix domain-containing protein [Bryobacteraceae bacterium]|nr:PepSY-associated TM helix domain-containing protein [Bryobacteraceae bacterium]
MPRNLWRRWTDRPQQLWARKALFQIHLWTGIAAALYVIVVSVSGGAIVLRQEIDKRVPRTIPTISAGTPLSPVQIQQRIEQAHPTDEILTIIEPRKPGQPFTVILEVGNQRVQRVLDPYTGAVLGDPRPPVVRVLDWLTDLHDNLLSGFIGRTLNGLGALLLVVMSLTGAVIWWPGSRNWRRSTRVQWRARFARLNWDLHSAIGFWCFVFVLIWGVSGILLCFPGTLDAVLGGHLRYWLTRLHFGRFNLALECVWTLLGLAPAALAVTGALMWWNRVLRKKVKRSRKQKEAVAAV